jgi:hypothetical protein
MLHQTATGALIVVFRYAWVEASKSSCWVEAPATDTWLNDDHLNTATQHNRLVSDLVKLSNVADLERDLGMGTWSGHRLRRR